jgi:hypothetical protein
MAAATTEIFLFAGDGPAHRAYEALCGVAVGRLAGPTVQPGATSGARGCAEESDDQERAGCGKEGDERRTPILDMELLQFVKVARGAGRDEEIVRCRRN